MGAATIVRPQADEHSEYYSRYIQRVPDGDLLTLLRTQIVDTAALVRGASARADYAYAPDKWTIKQTVLHLSDVERVMSYRALRFARNDATPVPGFDENAWADSARVSNRTLDDLVDELEVVRAATVQLASHLDPDELARRGTARNHGISVRALFYIIAGHERHHVALLKERYLNDV